MTATPSASMWFINKLLLTILLCYGHICSGQNIERGREYYLAFPVNDHSSSSADSTSKKKLILTILSASKKSANGYLSFVNDTNIVLEFHVDSLNTFVYNLPVEVEIGRQSAYKKAIKVIADNDVTVIGLSHDTLSSDAFLCYANENASKRYVVASYRNNMPSNTIGSPQNRCGAITIIGIHDSTSVVVSGKSQLQIGNHLFSDTTLLLNSCESIYCYSSLNDVNDITGSVVSSDKPIHVIASHERVAIPNPRQTMNCLIEYVPSISSLSTEYTIAPIYSKGQSVKCVLSVTAVFDTTAFTCGTNSIMINRSETRIIPVDSETVVHSDKPIVVALINASGTGVSDPTIRLSDPFLVYCAPFEQRIQDAAFVSFPLKDFVDHWIQVAVSDNDRSRFVLDDALVDSNVFHHVAFTSQAVANIQVVPGVHKINCSGGFNCFVYGEGLADSYGYCVGRSNKQLLDSLMDKTAPRFLSNEQCSQGTISIQDLGEYRSGLSETYVERTENCQVDSVYRLAGVQYIHYSLSNQHIGGCIELVASDISHNIARDTFCLDGLTLYSPPVAMLNEVGVSARKQILVKNKGRKSIDAAFRLISNTSISIPPSWVYKQHVIESFDSIYVPIVVYSHNDGLVSDTLLITDSCNRQLAIPINIYEDTLKYYIESKCGIRLSAGVKSPPLVVHNMNGKIYVSSGECNVSLFTYTGNLLYSGILSVDNPIDVSYLNSGLYFIIIERDYSKLIKVFVP